MSKYERRDKIARRAVKQTIDRIAGGAVETLPVTYYTWTDPIEGDRVFSRVKPPEGIRTQRLYDRARIADAYAMGITDAVAKTQDELRAAKEELHALKQDAKVIAGSEARAREASLINGHIEYKSWFPKQSLTLTGPQFNRPPRPAPCPLHFAGVHRWEYNQQLKLNICACGDERPRP